MKTSKGFLTVVVLLSVVFVCDSSIGQAVFKPESSFAYGWNTKIYVGKTQYYGDVSHDDKWEKLRAEAKLSLGASLTKEINPFFGLTADLFYSKLRSKKGPNNEPYPVMYYLSGTYLDFSISPRVDLVNLFADSRCPNKFSVYVTLGLGYAQWTSTVEDVKTGEIIRGEKGKWIGGLVIPTTLALNYNFYKGVSIFIDGQIRTIVNDKLDNWVDNWQTDQLFIGNIGISFDFDFKYHVKPSDINRSKVNESFIKEKVNHSKDK